MIKFGKPRFFPVFFPAVFLGGFPGGGPAGPENTRRFFRIAAIPVSRGGSNKGDFFH